MKDKKSIAKALAALSFKVANHASGTMSFAGYYQPKEPKLLKKK